MLKKHGFSCMSQTLAHKGQVNEFLELLREVWRFDRKGPTMAVPRRHRDFSRVHVSALRNSPTPPDDSIIANKTDDSFLHGKMYHIVSKENFCTRSRVLAPCASVRLDGESLNLRLCCVDRVTNRSVIRKKKRASYLLNRLTSQNRK